MPDYVFFYGTLMTPFNRPGRQHVESKLAFAGRGRIRAALFDLGIYPAAVPSDDDSTVAGEVYQLLDPGDGAGRRSMKSRASGPNEPERSLYLRVLDRRHARLWPVAAGVGVFLQRAARPRRADHRRATISNICEAVSGRGLGHR